jgi:hypothetical protein
MLLRVALLAAVGLAATAAVAAPDPAGFRGIDWDTPFDRHQREMQPVKDGVDADFYVRRDDALALGRAKLSSLSYAYIDGKFVGVVFRADGGANQKALLKALEDEYGKGRRSGTAGSLFMTWAGKRGRVEVYCQSSVVCIGSVASAKAHAAYDQREAGRPADQRPPARRVPGTVARAP